MHLIQPQKATVCRSSGPAEQQTSNLSIRFLSFPNLKLYPVLLVIIVLAAWSQPDFLVKPGEKRATNTLAFPETSADNFPSLLDWGAELCSNQYYHLNASPPSRPDPCSWGLLYISITSKKHQNFTSQPSWSHKLNFYVMGRMLDFTYFEISDWRVKFFKSRRTTWSYS